MKILILTLGLFFGLKVEAIKLNTVIKSDLASNEELADCRCSFPPEDSTLLPILDTTLTRYILTYNFMLPKYTMSRWKFSGKPVVLDGNKTYHELLVSDQRVGTSFTGSKRYFREEDQRFYQYISPTEGERLLYDMNLHLGDSISIMYADGLRNMVVVREDSIQYLDAKYRKRLTLKCVFEIMEDTDVPAEWIEGIGRISEPFVGFSHCSIWDVARPYVNCIFDVDGNRIFRSEDAAEDCWLADAGATDMDASTVWYSSSFIGDFVENDCRRKIDITRVMRDTMIDNRLCRIVGVTTGGKYLPESEVVLYSKADKMYFYEDKNWKLLYDFTAEVGDTVTYYVSKKYHYYVKYSVPTIYLQELVDDNPYQLIVTKVDSFYTSTGVPLKGFATERIFNPNGHFMGTIIANVGSVEKLFGNNIIISLPDCNVYSGLRCYEDDKVNIKFVESLCDDITEVTDLGQSSIKIYPNPGYHTLSLAFEELGDIVVTIYNGSGQQVHNSTHKASPSASIDTSDWTAGMYMVIVTDTAGKKWYAKWVKI